MNELWQKIGQELNMNEEEFISAIGTLHNLGYVLHYSFSSSLINNYVILDPQWMNDSIRSIVTINPEVTGFIEKGWLYHSDCQKIWPNYSQSTISFILGLLHYFGIAVPVKGGKSLIPCRLPSASISISKEYPFYGKIKRKFEFNNPLPNDIFPFIIGSNQLYEYLDILHCWNNAAIFGDDHEDRILLFTEGKNIFLIGRGGKELTEHITQVIQQVLSSR